MIELLLLGQAYLHLSLAIIRGESLQAAGPDYFEAQCYIDGYEAQGCAQARIDGIIYNVFPINMADGYE